MPKAGLCVDKPDRGVSTVCNTNKGDYCDPECRLLDPHLDDVEKLVVFAGPLAHAEPGSRADKTIERLKLNRSDLFLAREGGFENLAARFSTYVERCGQYEPDLVDQLWLVIVERTDGKQRDNSHLPAGRILEQQLETRGIAKPAPCH